jgi:hypothetical protein
VSAEILARIEAKLDRLLAQTGPRRPADDEKIHKDPKNTDKTTYWDGESFAGCKMSECPPEYLRALAKYKGACVWAANEAFKKKGDDKELRYVDSNKATAKLALAWAEYREAGGTEVSAPPVPTGKPVQTTMDVDDSDVQF